MNVYVIQAGNKKGPIKIGVADSPLKRMDELQTGNHVELVMLAIIPCISRLNAYHLETRLHRELGPMKIRGEWFQGKVRLWHILKQADRKGFKAEKIAQRTDAQKLLDKVRKKNFNKKEVTEFYEILKDKMKEGDFSPVDEILDEEIINKGEGND